MNMAFVYENRLRYNLWGYACISANLALALLAAHWLGWFLPWRAYNSGRVAGIIDALALFAAFAPSFLFFFKILPRLSAREATAAMDEEGLTIALEKERLAYRWPDIQSIAYDTRLRNPFARFAPYTGVVIEWGGKRRIFAHSDTDGKQETDDSSLYRFYAAARAQWIESNARKWHK